MPIDLYEEHGNRGGQHGLAEWLALCSVGQLCKLIRSYKLDPANRMHKQRDTRVLAEFIAERITYRLNQGAVFLEA